MAIVRNNYRVALKVQQFRYDPYVRIENRSAFHVTAKFAPLVDFVNDRCKYGDLITLRVGDLRDRQKFTGGMAHKFHPSNILYALVAPHLVVLQASHGSEYPRVSHHVDEVGDIVVSSWEEEFLLVLAHEARHIDQMRDVTHTEDQEHEAEVDAERFALAALKAWRKTATKRSRRTKAAELSL